MHPTNLVRDFSKTLCLSSTGTRGSSVNVLPIQSLFWLELSSSIQWRLRCNRRAVVEHFKTKLKPHMSHLYTTDQSVLEARVIWFHTFAVALRCLYLSADVRGFTRFFEFTPPLLHPVDPPSRPDENDRETWAVEDGVDADIEVGGGKAAQSGVFGIPCLLPDAHRSYACNVLCLQCALLEKAQRRIRLAETLWMDGSTG